MYFSAGMYVDDKIQLITLSTYSFFLHLWIEMKAKKSYNKSYCNLPNTHFFPENFFVRKEWVLIYTPQWNVDTFFTDKTLAIVMQYIAFIR